MPIRIIKKKKKEVEKVEEPAPGDDTEQRMMELLNNQRSFRQLGDSANNLNLDDDDGDDDHDDHHHLGDDGKAKDNHDDAGFTLDMESSESSDSSDEDEGKPKEKPCTRATPGRRGVARTKSVEGGRAGTRRRIRVNKESLEKLPDDVREKLEKMKLEAKSAEPKRRARSLSRGRRRVNSADGAVADSDMKSVGGGANAARRHRRTRSRHRSDRTAVAKPGAAAGGKHDDHSSGESEEPSDCED